MARGRRGRGRGGARGRRAVRVISSEEEQEKEISPEPTKQCEKSEPTAAGQSETTVQPMETDEGEQSAEKIETNIKSIGDTTSNKKDANESSCSNNNSKEIVEEEIRAPTIDMEADISQLEAPTFTTISRGPPEPMLHLEWNHKVNLIGEKVINPMIHCCDQCEKPILIYGRMIPCKHVFCLKCARNETLKVCPRCKEKAIRVEQTGLGTVFMCCHGGTRYESKGCRRTYLSQRDLQAHINHRHVNAPAVARLESLAVKISDTEATLSPNVSMSIATKKLSNRPGQTTTPIGIQSRSNTTTPHDASTPPKSTDGFFNVPSSNSSPYFSIPPPRHAPITSSPNMIPGMAQQSMAAQSGPSYYSSAYSRYSVSKIVSIRTLYKYFFIVLLVEQ